MTAANQDPDLVACLNSEIANGMSVEACDDATANQVIDRARHAFRIKYPSHWWWYSIGVPHDVYHYRGHNLLATIDRMLSDAHTAYLLVSDGREIPWPVYRGDTKSLLELVDKLPRFLEFGLVGIDYKWMVFVNSDDDLLCVVNRPKVVMA